VHDICRLVSSTVTSLDTMSLELIKMMKMMMMLRTMDGSCFMATFSAFHHIALCFVQHLVSFVIVLITSLSRPHARLVMLADLSFYLSRFLLYVQLSG